MFTMSAGRTLPAIPKSTCQISPRWALAMAVAFGFLAVEHLGGFAGDRSDRLIGQITVAGLFHLQPAHQFMALGGRQSFDCFLDLGNAHGANPKRCKAHKQASKLSRSPLATTFISVFVILGRLRR